MEREDNNQIEMESDKHLMDLLGGSRDEFIPNTGKLIIIFSDIYTNYNLFQKNFFFGNFMVSR